MHFCLELVVCGLVSRRLRPHRLSWHPAASHHCCAACRSPTCPSGERRYALPMQQAHMKITVQNRFRGFIVNTVAMESLASCSATEG